MNREAVNAILETFGKVVPYETILESGQTLIKELMLENRVLRTELDRMKAEAEAAKKPPPLTTGTANKAPGRENLPRF